MSEKRSSAWFILVPIVSIGVILLLALSMWSLYVPGMMGMMGYGMGQWWGWGFMFLIPLAFLVMIALGAYYLITESVGPSRRPSGNQRALEILKERYAKGEITKEQYIKMREELGI